MAKVLSNLKNRAENAVFEKYQIHYFDEFQLREYLSEEPRSFLHPTGKGEEEVKELAEMMRKVGPALKATAVV
jgi:hypothetical protein